jgi:two-component system, NtrC family, sensor kinase
MKVQPQILNPDFKGIGYSKIGYYKETRSKIKELETLNFELARRHNKLEAIFNNINDGLTILDRDFNIVFANQVQKALFPVGELIGQKCFHAYFHKTAACNGCPCLKTMRSKKKLQGEVFIKVAGPHGRYYEWTTSPIRDPSGKVFEIILLMRDITERKEYEYKLMQADRMAAVGFLAAGVAHEINNPLTSIAGFSEGLLKRFNTLDPELVPQQLQSFKEYLNIINSEAYRCKDIIHNLQIFSQTSSDDFENVPIDKIIKDTISLFRQRAKDQHVKINYSNHLTRGVDRVNGKASQLKHLFLNLIIRAFKSVEEGGELDISASTTGNQIEIAIRDSGESTSQGDKQFDLLSGKDGFGQDIDLSICYNIIQHHNGSIKMNTATDEGNKVAVYFPVST